MRSVAGGAASLSVGRKGEVNWNDSGIITGVGDESAESRQKSRSCVAVHHRIVADRDIRSFWIEMALSGASVRCHVGGEIVQVICVVRVLRGQSEPRLRFVLSFMEAAASRVRPECWRPARRLLRVRSWLLFN